MDSDPAPPQPLTPPPPTVLNIPSPFRRSQPPSSSSLEIRLFYARFIPCHVDAVPPLLTLSHLPRDLGCSLEINGTKLPHSQPSSVTLRLDRLDRDVSEATYVSTDSVRIAGAVDYEVCDDVGNLILTGTFERIETNWCNNERESSNGGWSMDCYSAASLAKTAFVQPKMGIVAPSIEVYVAGCFKGVPLILTQMIQMSPRRKNARMGGLEVIPEDEEGATAEGKQQNSQQVVDVLYSRRAASSSATEEETDEDDPDMKLGHSYYPEGWYTDEDGQLTWFNAGVRVGVGIGLGMCVGIGIGVGLLMRSYQTATKGFKRRFF